MKRKSVLTKKEYGHVEQKWLQKEWKNENDRIEMGIHTTNSNKKTEEEEEDEMEKWWWKVFYSAKAQYTNDWITYI